MSDGDFVLGVDAGTTSLRAALFDLRGALLAFADQSYETTYPRPGWAEQHPEDWWQALTRAVRECVALSGVNSERIIGLAIDAPCDVLLVDHSGKPLTESLMWMDLRAAEQARRLTQTHDPVLRYCGGETPAEWPLPKALWLKERMPAEWDQAAYVTEQMSWLTWRLTGVWAAPLNSATAKWHYRVETDGVTPAGWPTTLMKAVGLEDLAEKLPSRVVAMGARAGEMTMRAAEALGLRPGVAVAMSGIDAHAGMVGMNVVAPGTLALITGTSTCQLAQAPQPAFDPGLWGPFEAAVVPDAWTLEAGQASTGGTVRWLLETMGGALPSGETQYAAADAEAAAAPPGSAGLTVLDFWQGSRTPVKDPLARGAILGLTPAHTQGHLLRAVYEGTAYGNRHILDMLRQLGVATEDIRACGGGTRSALWLQILSDVADVPITLMEVSDAVALGTAMCAAVGAGTFSDLAAAGQAMARPQATIEPNSAHRAVYDDGYARYKAAATALTPVFHMAQE